MYRCAVLVFVVSSAAFAATTVDHEPTKPKTAKAHEIKVALGLSRRIVAFGDPVRITTEEELKKAVPVAENRAAILKQVDLRQEHLLLFSWSGSVSDKLTLADGDAGLAVFEYAHGLAALHIYHGKLFTIPAKGKFEVKKSR